MKINKREWIKDQINFMHLENIFAHLQKTEFIKLYSCWGHTDGKYINLSMVVIFPRSFPVSSG